MKMKKVDLSQEDKDLEEIFEKLFNTAMKLSFSDGSGHVHGYRLPYVQDGIGTRRI